MRERRRTFYIQAEIRTVIVVVRLPSDFGRDVEIFSDRRRGRLPFEASAGPRIGAGYFTVAHGPSEINHRQQVAQRQDGSSGSGHYIEHLKFRRVAGVAPGHAQITKNKLREKREIEAQEKSNRSDASQKFRIQLAGNLGPPVVQTADVTHHRSANHDVVEVGDDEISVVKMNVQAETGEEETGEAADKKKTDEAEGVQHRSIVGNRAFIERGGPVKDFDGRRNGNEVAEQREGERGVGGLTGEKHVGGPDKEADYGDGDTGAGDKRIAKDGLAGEGGNDFADNAHGGQNHDVDGGMGVKPKQVLEENGVATKLRIEEAEVKHALHASEQQSDGDHGCAEDEDDAGGVLRPDEERKAEPGHARRTHGVHGDDEIQASENGGEAIDENAEDGGSDGGIGIDAAERRVKGPASIQAAGGKGIEDEAATDQVNVPAQKIDLGKSQILGANHDGQKEITQHSGDGWDQEEEDHGHAMHGEQLVVGFRGDQKALGREQVNANHGGERAANEEKESDRSEVKQSDALVVSGKKPRTDSVSGVEVVLARHLIHRYWCSAHTYFFPVAGAIPEPLAGAGCDCKDLTYEVSAIICSSVSCP